MEKHGDGRFASTAAKRVVQLISDGFPTHRLFPAMTTILQIEDTLANKILVERALEPHGYTLLHAADGESGMNLALSETPDLILVDLGLPDIDGQTIVTMMKQRPSLANVPIIAITAWPPDVAQEMAERYGCDGLITKPINIKTFPDQIASYLQTANKDE